MTNMMGMMGAVVIFDGASVGAATAPDLQRKDQTGKPVAPTGRLPSDWMQKIVPPDGYTIQWVRSHLMGQLDLPNIQKRLDNGWEFVTPDKYPDYPSAPLEKAIETGGLILMCKETDRVQYDLAVERQEQVDTDPRVLKIAEEAREAIRQGMKYRGFTDWDVTLFMGRHWK